MRRGSTVTPIEQSWPTSKCQRLLRPLKLKIAALERAQSKSYSVQDELTPWPNVSAYRRAKADSGSESSSYHPSGVKLKKYGAARRIKSTLQTGTAKPGAPLCPEDMLSSLRAHANPSLASAYISVYYAFTSILERKEPAGRRFPSLANRAALTVGRCIHLTSQQFTENPIESDDWYDAVPAHLRADLVLGHAIQLLMSASLILGPLMPIITLAAKDVPLGAELMHTLLEQVDLTKCRKTEMENLRLLSKQVDMPWALQAYYARDFHVEFLKYPAFSVVMDADSKEVLEDSAVALYIAICTKTLPYLRKRDSSITDSDQRLYRVLEEMCARIMKSNDMSILSCFSSMFSSTQQALQHVSLGLSLRALTKDVSNVTLIESLAVLNKALLGKSITLKEDVLAYLTASLSPDNLVEMVECLVGRVDDLAITLANSCAITFEGEFFEWAEGIERDVLQGKSGEESEKYRYEPLLDSWVAKTPGMKKVHHHARLEVDYSSDEDESIFDEDGYHAEMSRSQLSFAEMDCVDEDDLMDIHKSADSKIPLGVVNILSARKPVDTCLSARLLKRYGSMSTNLVCQKSPLAKVLGRGSRIAQQLVQSPIVARPSRKRRYIEDKVDELNTQTSDASCPFSAKRLRSSKQTGSSSLMEMSERNPRDSNTRLVLRELNNLTSGFDRPRHRKRIRTLRVPVAPDTDEDDSIPGDLSTLTAHPRSEADDLAML